MDIKQLAKELGLSISTVSRALNGYTDVNPHTRVRVQEMAKQRGYRPNAGARRLVKGSTDAIGIVYSAAIENLGNPQFLDMAGGLAERLQQKHFDLLLAVAKDDGDLEIYDRLFRGGRVDAVIVPNTRVQDGRIDYLLGKGYPFLAYGRTADCADYSWFDFDNHQGSRDAVNHLLALGHTCFAYVHSPLELNFAHQRHEAFVAALDDAGLVCPPNYQLAGVVDRRGGLDAIAHLWKLNPRPTAIVVDNNLPGIGILRGLVDFGVQVGRDVSVVVHGDIPSDTLLAGTDVATVIQPTAHASGVTLADMVLQVLNSPDAGPYQLLRPSRLLLGASTGPAPTD